MRRTAGSYFDGDVAAAGRIDGQLFDLQPATRRCAAVAHHLLRRSQERAALAAREMYGVLRRENIGVSGQSVQSTIRSQTTGHGLCTPGHLEIAVAAPIRETVIAEKPLRGH